MAQRRLSNVASAAASSVAAVVAATRSAFVDATSSVAAALRCHDAALACRSVATAAAAAAAAAGGGGAATTLTTTTTIDDAELSESESSVESLSDGWLDIGGNETTRVSRGKLAQSTQFTDEMLED